MKAKVPRHWTSVAARAIMADLDDRKGVLDDVDDEIRKEMRIRIAHIIRDTYKESHENEN